MGYYVKNRQLQSGSTGVVLPTGSTAQRPTKPTFGLIRYNTDNGQIEFFNGTVFQYLTVAGGGDITVDKLGPGDGFETTFTMGQAEALPNEVTVFVGGLYQIPGVNYNTNGTVYITFTSPPPIGATINVIHYGENPN